MKNFSQILISILIASALLLAFQGSSFLKNKVNFSNEAASDFESNNSKDLGDEELKLGNITKEEIFVSPYKITLDIAFKISPHIDFSPAVPTSPPNA